MGVSMRIGIPSDHPGGIEAVRSDHFGNCNMFTIVELDEDGSIRSVESISNKIHGAGGCMVPITLLKEALVQAVIVGGIGTKPMEKLFNANISVYFADIRSISTVADAVNEFRNNNLVIMHYDQSCAGGPDCHH